MTDTTGRIRLDGGTRQERRAADDLLREIITIFNKHAGGSVPTGLHATLLQAADEDGCIDRLLALSIAHREVKRARWDERAASDSLSYDKVGRYWAALLQADGEGLSDSDMAARLSELAGTRRRGGTDGHLRLSRAEAERVVARYRHLTGSCSLDSAGSDVADPWAPGPCESDAAWQEAGERLGLSSKDVELLRLVDAGHVLSGSERTRLSRLRARMQQS